MNGNPAITTLRATTWQQQNCQYSKLGTRSSEIFRLEQELHVHLALAQVETMGLLDK